MSESCVQEYSDVIETPAGSAIRSRDDASGHYWASFAGDVPKVIGIRFDNRKSFQTCEPQLTFTEDVYINNMGTMSLGTVEFISALKLMGGRICVSSEGGTRLYRVIMSALDSGNHVYVSFRDISEISAAFLESSIGRLYQGDFAEEKIEEKVVIGGLSDDDSFILGKVIDRSKDFSKNIDHFEAVMNEVLGEDND